MLEVNNTLHNLIIMVTINISLNKLNKPLTINIKIGNNKMLKTAEISNIELQTEISNIEPQTEISNIEPQTEISNIEPQTEISNIELQTEISNIESQIEISNTELKTEIPNNSLLVEKMKTKKLKKKFNIRALKEVKNHCVQNLELAKISINNNNAIMRYFHKDTFDYEQIIHASRCTYRGMSMALSYMIKSLNEKKLKLANYCILCPHYFYDEKEPNKRWAGGDTQAGGGGKLTMKKDAKFELLSQESFEDGVVEELKEELRIIGNNPKLLVKTKNETIIKKQNMIFNTNIYSFDVNQCEIVEDFDVTTYEENQRGENIPNLYVGYIVWGTLKDCMEFVSKFKVNPMNFKNGNPIYTEKIDAISIVSLTRAFEMSEFAENYYENTKLTYEYVNQSFYD